MTVLIELQQQPAALAYAAALDAQTMAAAVDAGRAQIDVVATEQQRIAAVLAGPPFNATEIFRVRRVMNAIAATVDADAMRALGTIPGVKTVRPLEREFPTTSTSVPFVGAPSLWANTIGLNLPVTGAGIRIGIIDTGIDYQHATFGGTGALEQYQQNDRTSITDGNPGNPGSIFFPTAKVLGGWDFAGDDYEAIDSPVPVPDPDPMDCHGHGTHVAGTAAGFGVNSDGTTFTGPYGPAAPFGSLRIGPGTAPQASLYALRVFGCGAARGTNLTVQAIDWAMDPNGDGDLSDHLDVINLSLGSPFGGPSSTTALAADAAAAAGVIVVAPAGNNGDTYFINGALGSAIRAISVAASSEGAAGQHLRVNAPANIAGDYTAGKPNFGLPPPVGGTTGDVVIGLDPANADGMLTTDGCSPLTNDVAGKVVLLDRGTCTFISKVKRAQDAGAIAVIIANDTDTTALDITGTDPLVVIPTVRVGLTVGTQLKTAIGGPGLNITLFSTADTIGTTSSRGPGGGPGGSSSRPFILKPDLTAPGVAISSAQTGITCTGSGFSSGCLLNDASGYLPGSVERKQDGTSMASAHVAGIMALLRQLHPTWTVEELKALAMTSALHDVTTLPGGGGLRYGPGRIGAGRVDAVLAAQASVIAFNAEDPGAVSVSFEGNVAGTATRTKRVRLVNYGTTAQTYDLAIDTVVDAPGVEYSLPGGGSVTVQPGQSIELDVVMSADASQMDRVRDATVPAVQLPLVFGLANFDRHFLSEEAGYLTFSQNGTTRLRVPVYTVPAPVAAMSAPATIDTSGNASGSTTIPLSGTGVCTGTPGAPGAGTCSGTFSTDVVSLVTPFELQVVSPANPALAPPSADLQYVGVAYSAATDRVLFGVSTWGAWSTPTDTAVNIYIDCGVYTLAGNFAADTCDGVPDGVWDLIVFNSNPGSISQIYGSTLRPPHDIFITAVWAIQRGTMVISPLTHLNRLSGAAIDSRLYDNQVAFMILDRPRLKISAATGAFNYQVLTCPGSRPLCQEWDGLPLRRGSWPVLVELSAGQPGPELRRGQPGARPRRRVASGHLEYDESDEPRIARRAAPASPQRARSARGGRRAAGYGNERSRHHAVRRAVRAIGGTAGRHSQSASPITQARRRRAFR